MSTLGNKKSLHGAAAFTHKLKEYGGGHSMVAGLIRYGREQKQAGRKEGFQLGINYVLQKFTDRMEGRQAKSRLR